MYSEAVNLKTVKPQVRRFISYGQLRFQA